MWNLEEKSPRNIDMPLQNLLVSGSLPENKKLEASPMQVSRNRIQLLLWETTKC
jgi:hypothetical protein